MRSVWRPTLLPSGVSADYETGPVASFIMAGIHSEDVP